MGRGGKSAKKIKGCYEVEDGDSSSATTSGCMTAVSQFFDFHHFHLRILPHNNPTHDHHHRHHHRQPPFAADSNFLPPRPPLHVLKGLEAPRNSLEEDAFAPSCLDASSAIHQTMKLENLNIPMGRIQIKTSTRGEDTFTQTPRESTSNTKVLTYSSADNTLCSPGPKTPNLVARLMGLDTIISPSPPPSHSSSQRMSSQYPRRRSCSDNITSGSRSLPETPRVSSERRSDVDRHHRLSLQINKENNADHETMSPRNYAKRILKQVKERVSRRVGMDITNTNTVSNKEERRDENLLGSRSKKSQKGSTTINLNKDDHHQVNSKKANFSLPPKPSLEANKFPGPEKRGQEKEKSVNKKCKKFGNSMSKLKKEEPFVRASVIASRVNNSDKKCKKTPLLSNDLQSFLPVKKDSSPPATKLPLEQALSDAHCSKISTLQLSSGSSHNINQKLVIQNHRRHGDLDNTLHSEIGLIQYIAGLLRRIGINKDTSLVSFSRWFSAYNHPLDPSIFHHLELAFSAPVTGQLSLRCNRKLIFDLAGEVLGHILKPYVESKPWIRVIRVRVSPCTMWHDHLVHGGQLIDQMYAKIINFPQANCQTLQDIDALIDRDLQNEPPNIAQNVVAFEEEGATIVLDIERDILDSLVHETAAFLAMGGPVD